MLPKYEFGEEVRIIRNVRNDGTYPGVAHRHAADPSRLHRLRHQRRHLPAGPADLYRQLLEQNKIVGFREEELISIDDPWIPSKFESREKVRSKITLTVRGEVRVNPGMEGEILKVFRDEGQRRAVSRDLSRPGAASTRGFIGGNKSL